MNAKKVSIVMNCYNGEKYLNQSIQSVLDQTYSNWELIFWDNNSNDKSAEIFKSFNDNRLKYFFSSQKTSLHNARNFALSKTSGDYIAFIDTDDYWKKNKLETQIRQFANDQNNFSAIQSKYYIKYENFFLNKISTTDKLPNGNIFSKIVSNYNTTFLSMLFKKNSFENFPNVFNTRYDLISDFDFILRYTYKNNIFSIQKPLFVYRKHEKNMSKINYAKQVLEMRDWLNYLKKKGLYKIETILELEKHVKKMHDKLLIQSLNLFEFLKFLILNKDMNKIRMLIYFIFKKII